MSKRDDLQWLRALAIIAVVAFHLKPKFFPFGFLGVDIFFVISGYLMPMILSKEPDTLTFYLRRIKRIFPIYFLIITLFFGIGYFKLLPSHFEFLKIEVLWSVFFANNFPPMFEKKEYFQMISEYEFLLHTWSLSVEIQFYLISPILIKSILSKSRPLFWTFFFSLFSFLLQAFIPNNSVSFGLVFCRIWQFLIGTFAFLYSNQNYNGYVLVDDDDHNYVSFASEDEMEIENKVSQHPNINVTESAKNLCLSFFVFLLLILICFISLEILSSSIFSYVFRVLSTILTGTFIALHNSRSLNIPLFINSIFVYIGDISYVIYLIHWPIIIFFKYLNVNYGDFFTVLCIFSSTLFIHECFERPLGKLSLNWNIAVVVFCFCGITFLCFIKKETILTSLNPIEINQQEAHSCGDFYYKNSCKINPLLEKYLKIRPKSNALDRYCSITLNPKSNKTILITGNSFVYFQIRGILESIKQSKQEFSEAFVISHPFCDVIVGKLNTNAEQPCNGTDISHDELLEILRPNMIVHSGRIDQFFPETVLPIFNLTSDFYYKEIKQQILHIASFTRRLIIIEPHPPFLKGYLSPLTVGHTLLLNNSPSKFNISVKEFHRKHDPSWNRVKEAVKYCKNCVIIPTEQIMCPTSNICPMVDPISQIGFFCDRYHITPKQSLKLVPSLLKAIDGEKRQI